MAKVFFDTNIAFYAYDNSSPVKQAIAQRLLLRHVANGSGYTSVQVLGEFYHATVIRKKVLTADVAEQIVEQLGSLTVVSIGMATMRRAMGIQKNFQVSYWDSLVLAAAQLSHCEILYTEDLNAGQSYGEVTAVNPFC